MRKQALIYTLIGFFTMLMLNGATTIQARQEAREEFHQSYPLAANGTIVLENVNGSVTITVWDRNEVKVDAVKHAGNQERLEEVRIVVDAHPNSIRIRTEYPSNFGKGYSDPGGVEYQLTVPKGAGLEEIELVNGNLDIQGVAGDVSASAVNGEVTANGLSGKVDLSTVNGRLDVTFERLSPKPVSLESVNGSIVLKIPSGADATLEATTVSGNISNDFGLRVDDGSFVGHDLSGVLGKGGTKVELSNVNGSISIRRASAL